MGDYRAMFNRDYIGAWDLPGDVVITIIEVKAVELQNKSGKDKKPVIYFETAKGRSAKGFVSNKTNCKTIVGITGSTKVEDWIGKKITLFATTCDVAGDVQECIRVRPEAPKLGES